jgi:hypothetical protein
MERSSLLDNLPDRTVTRIEPARSWPPESDMLSQYAHKMVVESKEDMRKRGMRSPDLADAFLLTFACGLEKKIDAYRRPVARKHSAWAA